MFEIKLQEGCQVVRTERCADEELIDYIEGILLGFDADEGFKPLQNYAVTFRQVSA